MQSTDLFQFEFDGDNRILHLSYRSVLYIKTEERLRLLMGGFSEYLQSHFGTERIYIVINMSRLIIEPELSRLYGQLAGEISDAFTHPNGIARYGHQITRITVRRGYTEYRNEDPNLFGTRVEAEGFIRSLIARTRAESPEQTINATPEKSSVD
jgi:hypothetical protein